MFIYTVYIYTVYIFTQEVPVTKSKDMHLAFFKAHINKIKFLGNPQSGLMKPSQ